MIRVLRLIEYIYEDNSRAESDMARWQIPANGSQRHGTMVIKSSTITDLNFKPASLVYTVNVMTPGRYQIVTGEDGLITIEPAPES